MGVLLLNILFGFLGFFATVYIAGKLLPEGNDKEKGVFVLALIIGVIVFLLNLAEQLLART